MLGVFFVHNELMPFKKKNKKMNLKQKEEEIMYSLFEVEKFLYCCNKAKKYGYIAKLINRNLHR